MVKPLYKLGHVNFYDNTTWCATNEAPRCVWEHHYGITGSLNAEALDWHSGNFSEAGLRDLEVVECVKCLENIAVFGAAAARRLQELKG